MILVLLSGCFVFFPYSRFVNNNKKDGCCGGVFLKLMTCFAAGMLLTLSIVHIMPEAMGIYKAYQIEMMEESEGDHRRRRMLAEGEIDDFPVPSVIFFCGFMTMMFLD